MRPVRRRHGQNSQILSWVRNTPGLSRPGVTRGSGLCRFCSFRRQPARSSTPRIRLSCLTMSCVNLPATASNFTNDESALKTLWLMICNIEDKRLAKRAKEGWRVACFSRPPCRRRESLRVETSHQPNASPTRSDSTNTPRNQAPHTNNLTRSFRGGAQPQALHVRRVFTR